MLSEQYFKNTTWPAVESIESMISKDGKIEIISQMMVKKL